MTGGYAVPDDACFSYRELYRRLAELEAKTHEHVHVENNVYFPRAVELEENAGTRRRSPSPAERADRPAATECCT